MDVEFDAAIRVCEALPESSLAARLLIESLMALVALPACVYSYGLPRVFLNLRDTNG